MAIPLREGSIPHSALVWVSRPTVPHWHPWPRVASACSGLKLGLCSRPVTEVGSRQWEPRIVATRPAASDIPWPYGFAEKEFPQRRKVVKQGKYLLGEKEARYVRIDTQAGSERESRPRGRLNHLYGAFLPGFLWPLILICLVLSSYLV